MNRYEDRLEFLTNCKSVITDKTILEEIDKEIQEILLELDGEMV